MCRFVTTSPIIEPLSENGIQTSWSLQSIFTKQLNCIMWIEYTLRNLATLIACIFIAVIKIYVNVKSVSWYPEENIFF